MAAGWGMDKPKKIDLYAPSAVIDRIRKLAKAESRPVGATLRVLVTEALEAREARQHQS